MSLLLNDDGSMALLGGNTVVRVLESNNGVAFGFGSGAVEVRDFGVEGGGSSAESHSFNGVLRFKNLKKLVNLNVR